MDPYDSGGFDYVYQYKDHLGNIRLSYSDTNGDGQISASAEILEENNYYPFGLKHKGYNYAINSTNIALKRKFGGNELQDELGLDWYDITARNYDPALGRWMNLDPLAETSRRFSPYTYALNNPVYFIDPDGMQAIASPGPQPLALTYNNPDAAGFSFNGAGGAGFNFDIGSTHFSRSNTQSSSDPKKNSSTKYKEFFRQKSEEIQAEFGLENGDENSIGELTIRQTGELAYITGRISLGLTLTGEGFKTSGSTFRLTTTTRGFSPKIYFSGWSGNQYASTFKVGRVGKLFGLFGFGVSFASDLYGLRQYYVYGPSHQDAVSPVKFGANTSIGLYGFSGFSGGVFSVMYFGFEVFYPGGFGQALQDKATRDAETSKILGKPFNSSNQGTYSPFKQR